ncbi:MAG: nuclear transport factor 2 family protein [Thermoleophilaceae bacterium]|nr:nuclear transport factor 2 family protein [Thermoleophilaceae bacterium]
MSRENAEVIERAVGAVNARDLDGYLACCTPDIEIHTPLASIGGVYDGPSGIRRWFSDLEDVGPDFRLELERAETIRPGRVLAFLRVTGSGRTSGLQVTDATPITNVYDLVGGKISRVRIFMDRQEALEAVGLSE